MTELISWHEESEVWRSSPALRTMWFLRGNNRRRLFSYPREYRYFSRRVVHSSRKQAVHVHAWALMANHVHLLVTPPDSDALARFVKAFAQSYALYRNKRRVATGKLFEQRYRVERIKDVDHLATTTAYIDLNPTRAGICTEPEDYPWSTYRHHSGVGEPDLAMAGVWSPSDWYLSLSSQVRGRRRAYRDLVDRYRARNDWAGVTRDPAVASDRKRVERPDRSGAG
ncbi:MAG: transposase [Myxococcota bacterium]